jgi:hypothetical protein
MAEYFPLLRFTSAAGRLLFDRPDLWNEPRFLMTIRVARD